MLAVIALAIVYYPRDGGAPDTAQVSEIGATGPAASRPDAAQVEAATVVPELSTRVTGPEQAASFEQMAREVFEHSIVKTVQDFRADLQAFIRDAELLPAQDHEPGARELLARVDLLAAGGYVTGPEALALRLSLLRYALPPDDYRSAADALIGAARQRAEQAEREWAERSDPRLERYRAEERRVIEQTATMQDFPNGLTRQAYLREKLRDLRSEIYSE